MKILFIGGTGFISTEVSRRVVALGHELYLFNRGTRGNAVPGAKQIVADINDVAKLKTQLEGHYFDSVVDWITFTPDQIERDIELFSGKTDQFVFISSASAYQKPPVNYLITESTPLHNPHWQYSRDKIACEEALNRAYRELDFPITIVRPSLTYDTNLPIAMGGWGCYTLIDRIKKGRPIIVHGDGSSLWTVTHAEDFAKGFVGLLGNPKVIGHAFHITSDEVLTWNQIYQSIGDAVGVQPKMVHIPSDFICEVSPDHFGSLFGDKAWSAVFDNSKIKSFVPEFRATIPFAQGVVRTVKWFEEKPERMRIDQNVNQDMDNILQKYLAK